MDRKNSGKMKKMAKPPKFELLDMGEGRRKRQAANLSNSSALLLKDLVVFVRYLVLYYVCQS